MEYLDGNPKDAIGSTKVPMGLVPATFIAETSLAFLEGKEKYGQVNWRASPVRASVYIDALKRHIAKYEEGQDRDLTTLVHHLGNGGACMGILIDAAVHGTLVDDRNFTKRNVVAEYIDALATKVAHIKNLFKDKKPKHWTQEDMKDELRVQTEREELRNE
jgi:hypothetical protein